MNNQFTPKKTGNNTQSKTQKQGKDPNFLELVYQELSQAIEAYANDLPEKMDEFKNDLYEIYETNIKQSFSNGIRVGQRKAQSNK